MFVINNYKGTFKNLCDLNSIMDKLINNNTLIK